jgi:hypothetical protein
MDPPVELREVVVDDLDLIGMEIKGYVQNGHLQADRVVDENLNIGVGFEHRSRKTGLHVKRTSRSRHSNATRRN